jgi:phosphoribosylamine-glycine ligase
VLTYKVPPDYGGFMSVYPDKVAASEVCSPVDLSRAYELSRKTGGKIRVYPGSMELREGRTYALKSRAVGVLAVGGSIEEARQLSLEGARAISGGALWSRTDIASAEHIAKSVSHMEQLRRRA